MSLSNKDLFPDQEVINQLEKQGDNNTAFGDKSPGVRRIEAISKCFQSWHRWVLFVAIFLVAYSYGLDGSVRYNYQNIAFSTEFESSAQISTVAVVRAITAAAAQPAFAKLSDYFGRMTILAAAIVFFIIGTVLNAAAKNLDQYLGGSVLYQFGYTGLQLLVEVIIADTTSLRSRLLFSYIPAMPFLINAWVSGDIAVAVLGATTWRWGIAMWCIILPITCIPIFFSLTSAERRAKRLGLLDGIPSPFKSLRKFSLWKDFFWQIDVIGLLLLAGTFTTILLPFTLAGGSGTVWKSARTIAPLVVGVVVVLPAFLIWELRFAPHPAVPFRLLKDRQIIAGLSIACLLNTAWYTQGDYLYYLLLVAFDLPIQKITRIQYIYSFVSVVIGIILGFVVRHVRRAKWFVVAGTAIFVIAFGLLLRYRSSEHGGLTGLIAGETLLGIGGGMFPYPTQMLVQSAVQHERLAIITSLYLATYSIGSALGNTIAAGIWINVLPGEITNTFASNGVVNATAEALAFADPFSFVAAYPVGTPERTGLIYAYAHTQRLLCIAGICLSGLIFVVSLFLRNPHLGDEQFLPDAEGFKTLPEEGVHARGFAKSDESGEDGQSAGVRADGTEPSDAGFRKDKAQSQASSS